MKEFLKRFFNSPLKQTGQSFFNISFGVVRKLFSFILIGLFLLSILFFGIGIGYFTQIISKTDVPSLTSMQTSLGKLSQASTLFYQNGEMISHVQSDLIRDIIKGEDISDFVKNGIIATEDSYFFEHEGIVPKAVVRATLQDIFGTATQSGGSTLTQQLVKQQLLTSEYTFTRKAKELLLAMRVEKHFSKDDILTAYLNVSPFGRNSDGKNIAGIQSAAKGVFGKNAKDLTLPQAAYLVGLPQSPYVYTPFTNTGTIKQDVSAGIKRMHIVLDAMKRDGYISQEQWQSAMNYDITKDFIAPTNSQLPMQNYLYQAVHREATTVLMKQAIEKDGKVWEDVVNEPVLYQNYYALASDLLSNGGYNVYSTIDKSIYDAMQQVTRTTLPSVGGTFRTPYIDSQTQESKIGVEPVQMGSIAIENATGKVLGFVGGADFSISQSDHAFSTRRSPGSTIKPLLVYGPAIEQNLIYPATMLADFPIRKLQPDGTYWTPTNASGSTSNSFVSTRHALRMSLNNPVIHLYSHMLSNGFKPEEYMQKMGITGIDSSEFYNESASVGGFSNGTTVLEQTAAFMTFANNGEFKPAYVIEKITDRDGNIIYEHQSSATRVFSEDTAFLMRSMLKDVVNGGTAQEITPNLRFRLPDLIAKTGTSDLYQDLWLLASTPKITIGQWTGWDNAYGVKHTFSQQSSGAAQRLWSAIANAINGVNPNYFNSADRFAPQPATVQRLNVLSSTGTTGGTMRLQDGRTLTLSGANTSDFFSQSRPPFALDYNFSPGASPQHTAGFWNNIFNPQRQQTTRTNQSNNNSNNQNNLANQNSQSSANSQNENNSNR